MKAYFRDSNERKKGSRSFYLYSRNDSLYVKRLYLKVILIRRATG